jgi:hypothetical protein
MALTRPKIKDLDTSVIGFTDAITVLHQGASVANVDVGFLFNRANGLVSNVAIYWSEASNSFVTGFTTASGVTNANISASSYANVTTGGHIVTGTLTATAVQAGTIGNASAVLYGTLNSASASQPNVTTLAGLTGFGTAGVTTTAAGNFTITGCLTVNGTTTTINNTTVEATEYVTTIYASGINAATIGNAGATLTGATVTTSGTIIASGNIVGASGTNSTSNVTGAIVVSGSGGLGVAGNLYVGNRTGYVWGANSVSAVYQVFNNATGTLDTIFG